MKKNAVNRIVSHVPNFNQPVAKCEGGENISNDLGYNVLIA